MEAKMKPVLMLALAGLVGASSAPEPAALSEEAQGRLDHALEGRMAEPAVSCVSQRLLRNNRSIGESVILFEGANGRLYVNRPPAGCPSLEYGRSMLTHTPMSQLCEGDIVTIFDPVSRFEYGSCGLGNFVPYRRTD
jgi:hypothetical protein